MITRFKGLLKRAVKRTFALAGLEVRRASRTRRRSAGTGGGITQKKPAPYRRASEESLYDAVDFLRSAALDEINRNLQRRIAAEVREGRPLRVGFLVNDRSKWNGDSLLDEMRAAGWSTRLYLCLSNVGYADQDEKRAAYQAERDYFAQIDGDLVDLYDWSEDLEIPVEDAVTSDVVFYQQPWGMKDYPRRLAGRSLGAYMHYGFMMMANHGMHYHIGSFHPYLWRYFTQTEAHRLLHLQHEPSAHHQLVVTGYPKLDVFLTEPDERALSRFWPGSDESSVRIVYAPHHSLGRDNLGMSTFAWNHDFMLSLARTTPGTHWVYKPHPNLKYSAARNKVMTRAAYAEYEANWAALPNAVVYDGGSYFDIFRSSDAMITDSGSFLAEYLPTGKPIIWLMSSETVGFNTVGMSMAEAYYRVRSVPELAETFQRVIVDQQDPLKDQRSQAVHRLFPSGGKAATAVVEHLREQLVPGQSS